MTLAATDSELWLRPWPRQAVRTIEVARAAGSGPTELAAFDAALRHAGVANFNLIRLSSVIPPSSAVVEVGQSGAQAHGEWGDRLYVVLAEMRADVPGQEAWAGIGWVQQEASGKGLFVEHEGHCEPEVRRDLARSLSALTAGRPEAFGPHHYAVHGAVCRDAPVCALVVAVFESAAWSEPPVRASSAQPSWSG